MYVCIVSFYDCGREPQALSSGIHFFVPFLFSFAEAPSQWYSERATPNA